MPLSESIYKPGQRVRVTQQVPRLSGSQTITVEGTVVAYHHAKTGSWFAHSKDRKLWLERLEIRLDNGELAMLNLDQFTHVEALAGA